MRSIVRDKYGRDLRESEGSAYHYSSTRSNLLYESNFSVRSLIEEEVAPRGLRPRGEFVHFSHACKRM
jgi:hypothetical protein